VVVVVMMVVVVLYRQPDSEITTLWCCRNMIYFHFARGLVTVFRPNSLHAVHRCQPIATDVTRSMVCVCLSVYMCEHV